MGSRIVLGTVSGRMPLERVELAVQQDARGLTFELCEQHYADGIGWFDQRSIELDSRQLREIQTLLGQKPSSVLEATTPAPATLPYPGPLDRPSRAATGESA